MFEPKYFNPIGEKTPQGAISFASGDSLYVYDSALIFAVNVALAAERPLLLAGEPGCGKTTLARNAAKVLGWSYYHYTVSSRTQASDLLWEYDALRRLNDAYVRHRTILSDGHYVEPGKLWWALDPKSAERRGMDEISDEYVLKDPGEAGPKNSAVVLLDEIDKAEPDVPNDLLEILDARSFRVKNKPIVATRAPVLIVITTNGERELPGAFQRRCIVYRFPAPTADWYVNVAQRWFPAGPVDLFRQIATRLMDARERAAGVGQRMPGTAEYLDAVRACDKLGVDPAGDDWKDLERWVFDKEAALDSRNLRS